MYVISHWNFYSINFLLPEITKARLDNFKIYFSIVHINYKVCLYNNLFDVRNVKTKVQVSDNKQVIMYLRCSQHIFLTYFVYILLLSVIKLVN